MASYFPPKKATQLIFYISLESVASAGTFQTNPTIASGDFKVSIDGGSLTNLTTLPTVTPAGSKMVKVTLSSSEMNGDNVTLVCSDASGGEWYDLTVNIPTVTNQLDDIAGYIDTEVSAIKAKTDNLPASPADQTTLNTIAGYLDTEIATLVTNVASILADTGTEGVVLNLTTANLNAIADRVLARSRSNQDNTADTNSLYELIGLILQGDASSGSMVVPKSNGSTTFNTRTLTTDNAAEPITKIAQA